MNKTTAAVDLRFILDSLENIELQQYGENPAQSSYDEQDAKCPVFYAFYSAGGGGGILDLSNFNPLVSINLLYSVHDYFFAHWNLGNRSKSSKTAMNVLLWLFLFRSKAVHWT